MANITLLEDKLSEHFWLHEFVCHDGKNSMKLTPEILFFITVLLEAFREWYGRPIPINSGFRTAIYNAALKLASPTSTHLLGLAVDIPFPRRDHDGSIMAGARKRQFLENVRTKWYSILKEHELTGGVGFYDWGFHLDAGNRTEQMRFFDYRS